MDREATDLRVVKTRAAIQSQFLDLLLRKNFNAITVKDITTAARVGRGTFYLHYKDKYDLLETVIEEGLSEAVDHFHPHDYFVDGEAVPERLIAFILEIFHHFKNNARFFQAMFFNEGIPMFRLRMQQRFMRKFSVEVRRMRFSGAKPDPLTLEILPIFISSAMIGLVSWWFEQQMRIPEDEIARRVFRIMTQGPLRTLGAAFRKESTDGRESR